MSDHLPTLILDNVQVRSTLGTMTMSGWMQVTEQLPRETAEVLRRLQEGTCEPWLAPRHQWMLKEGIVYAYFDNVRGGMLWAEHDKTAEIAAKGIKLLERIMSIILATNGSASWNLLAESADRIRKAGVPIVYNEGKE